MPRTARVVLPGFPHHVIQRGHNRQVVFSSDEDYLLYLANLAERKKELGLKVYAYCLMTNHVHLILDPGGDPGALALLMKRVAGRQTRYVNKRAGRSGTLWEGRYKSSPIETDRYLLAACRYVELNPVRAKMVEQPEQYPWSSYQDKITPSKPHLIDPDPCYLALGSTDTLRKKRYREWVAQAVPDGEWDAIRLAVRRGQLTSGGRFVDEVEQRFGRRVEFRGPGRPRKHRK